MNTNTVENRIRIFHEDTENKEVFGRCQRADEEKEFILKKTADDRFELECGTGLVEGNGCGLLDKKGKRLPCALTYAATRVEICKCLGMTEDQYNTALANLAHKGAFDISNYRPGFSQIGLQSPERNTNDIEGHRFTCRNGVEAIISLTGGRTGKAHRICPKNQINTFGNLCDQDAITCEMFRMDTKQMETAANELGVTVEELKIAFKSSLF